MSQVDFDLEGLARYLHVSPAQVQKLAERGALPGRKISGQWRFSSAEVHHWLEARIGLAGEADLLEVEGLLQSAATAAGKTPPRLLEMLPLEAIAIPLLARTRNSVITAMVELGAKSGWLWDVPKMTEAVRTRESLHPTALDCGVALLHPRRPLPQVLAQPLLAMGRTLQGVPFGQSNGQLTDVFFLIASADDAGHLQTLARLSRLIGNFAFLPAIRAAADAKQALQIVEKYENEIEL